MKEARLSNYLPQVLLNILPHDIPIISNKIRHIQQSILLFFDLSMAFNNSSRNNANPTLLCQILVLLQVCFPLLAQADKTRVFW